MASKLSLRLELFSAESDVPDSEISVELEPRLRPDVSAVSGFDLVFEFSLPVANLLIGL